MFFNYATKNLYLLLLFVIFFSQITLLNSNFNFFFKITNRQPDRREALGRRGLGRQSVQDPQTPQEDRREPHTQGRGRRG